MNGSLRPIYEITVGGTETDLVYFLRLDPNIMVRYSSADLDPGG
jgi:hypothetical protein